MTGLQTPKFRRKYLREREKIARKIEGEINMMVVDPKPNPKPEPKPDPKPNP